MWRKPWAATRSTVANALRLLKLPDVVLAMLHEGQLTVGHARALLGLDDPRVVANLAREAVAQGLSVPRSGGSGARQGACPSAGRPRSKKGVGPAPEVRRVEYRPAPAPWAPMYACPSGRRGRGSCTSRSTRTKISPASSSSSSARPSTDDARERAGRDDRRPGGRRPQHPPVPVAPLGVHGGEVGHCARRGPRRPLLLVRRTDHALGCPGPRLSARLPASRPRTPACRSSPPH